MPSTVSIARLSQHLELVPLVASWLRSEWPFWYGQSGDGNADSDALAYARPEASVPLGIVAFNAGIPVGFGALKNEGVPPGSERRPWVGAGYVVPELRSQGIGAAILQALLREAKAMGYTTLYCGTSTASSLLEREGWHRLEVVPHGEVQVVVFERAV